MCKQNRKKEPQEVIREIMKSANKEAKQCCRLIPDSIMRLFYFTPHWLVGVTP